MTTTTQGSMDGARSLVRTLMRGDRATWRRGHDGKLATGVAARMHDLTEQQALELIAYAWGLSQGMRPDAVLDTGALCDEHAAIVAAGFSDGQQVDLRLAFPAEVTAP